MAPAIPSGERATLSVRGLTLTTGVPGALPLVDRVDLDVAAGELVALVGRSGSGKTLTGRAICDVLPRTVGRASGTVHCVGRDGAPTRPHCIPQSGQTALDPFSTVGASVTRALRRADARGLPSASASVEACLARAGLPPRGRFAERYPFELSGGEARRVTIALACAAGAELIVADEPTTGLDPSLRTDIAECIASLVTDRCGVLLITHEIGLFARHVDRMHVMHAGRIDAVLTPGAARWTGIPPRGPALALLSAAHALEARPPATSTGDRSP